MGSQDGAGSPSHGGGADQGGKGGQQPKYVEAQNDFNKSGIKFGVYKSLVRRVDRRHLACDYERNDDRGCRYASDCMCYHKKDGETEYPKEIHCYDARQTVRWNVQKVCDLVNTAEAKTHYDQLFNKY